MDKDHKNILKQVKDYIEAPLTEDEISANNYTYYAGTWFMPNINELTNDKETIYAIKDFLDQEQAKCNAFFWKKYGDPLKTPWAGRENDSLFLSKKKNAFQVKRQKIMDCTIKLKLPGVSNAIKYSWEYGNLIYVCIALGILSLLIAFTNGFQGSGGSGGSGGSSSDEWFCQYDDPINKKGKKCYRDTDGDGIPDEEW